MKLSRPGRKPATRRYAMRQRQEQMEDTRRRIAAAAAALHEELGPRNTSIRAIAERAGVERLTVYRHFPDENALFAGCSAHWVANNPPPDPAAWAGEQDPARRTGRALQALYAYFARSQRMLAAVHRDLEHLPALARATQPFLDFLQHLATDLAGPWRRSGAAIVLAHAVQFSTWQSLEKAGAQANTRKASLIVAWLQALSPAQK